MACPTPIRSSAVPAELMVRAQRPRAVQLRRFGPLLLAAVLVAACGARTGAAEDECPASAVQTLRVAWTAAPRRLQVVFVVDVTGSMTPEIVAIIERADEVAIALHALAPEVLVDVAATGDGGGRAAGPRSATVADTAALLSYTRALIEDGGDPAEGQLTAPYGYLSEDPDFYRFSFVRGGGLPPRCVPGAPGAPCLEPTTPRLFIFATDSPFHLGPGGSNPYRDDPQPPCSFEAVRDLLQSTRSRAIVAYGDTGGVVRAEVEALARVSGAVRADGTPIAIEGAGAAMVDGLLEAVRQWRDEVPFDLAVRATVTGAAPGLVERVRIVSIVPPPMGLVGDDRASGVTPGAIVELEVDIDPAQILRGRRATIALELWDADRVVLDRVELEYALPREPFVACSLDGGPG